MPLRAGWLVTAFAGAMLIPACALGWLSVRFLEQEAKLRETQLRERQELAADRAVAQIEQAVSASERLLNRPEGFREDDAAIVTSEDSRVRIFAGKKLLFSPVEVEFLGNTRVFDDGERFEFQRQDLAAAIAAYRTLTEDGDAAVRAGAWLRLGRTLQKMGRAREAMAAWNELGHYAGVRINGVPADLVAVRASGLKKVVAEGLAEGRWEIDAATFTRYADEVGWQPDAKRVALAAAVEWARGQMGQAKPRAAKEFAGRRMVILTIGSRALVAGPDFQARLWFAGLDQSQVVVGGGWGANAAVRTAAATGLPWSVAVRRASVSEQEGRRGVILVGIGLLVVAVLATVVLLVVVLSKELAVARLKSDFVAAVSHEFRTPLTTLRQYNEMLLEEDGLSAAEQREYLVVQQNATERLHRLVESLLDFRRMEGRGWTHRMHVLDVERLVGDVVEEFRREAAGRNFEIECSTSRAQVEGDAEALGRALWNLLDNAVKYSDQSRAIEVGMVRQNGHVRVSVRDHGAGIAKADQKRIFDTFVRTEESRRKGIQGTGIGLAMVRQIATAHGGRVELISEPAQGSTFTLVLPLKETACSES